MKFKMCVLTIVLVLVCFAYGEAFEFPAAKTDAKADEYVLAPSLEAGQINKDAVVIYYSRTMVAPGADASSIKSAFNEFKMPNSLIIRIPKGRKAKKGDVLLTWWQSGSGLTRAYVVDASNPKEPVVQYLDDSKKKDEKLKADSFVKLAEMLTPGTTVAFKDKEWNRWGHAKVVNMVGNKIITIGFGGKMKIFNKSDCLPVPVIPKVKVGGEAYVLSFSSFSKTKIKKIDKRNGRVITEKGDEVAFCDVLNPVQVAQILLKKQGYNPGRIDGILGVETETAIRKFQKAQSLSVDGKATFELLEVLFSKA